MDNQYARIAFPLSSPTNQAESVASGKAMRCMLFRGWMRKDYTIGGSIIGKPIHERRC